MKGRVPSQEHREKISLALKEKTGNLITIIDKNSGKIIRNNLGRFERGNNYYQKLPNHLSIEARRRISKNISGKKHPNWKGGRKEYCLKMRSEMSGFHTLVEWENLKSQYNWTCPCCHKKEPMIKLTKDHVIPVIKGGSNNIENIQPLCLSCNVKKHTKIIKYSMEIK